jgi:hypothetical protein
MKSKALIGFAVWATVFIVLAALLGGCAGSLEKFDATQVAKYQHPTGKTMFCINPHFSDGLAYASCKTNLESLGYQRIPLDSASQYAIDKFDAARAESIRKR